MRNMQKYISDFEVIENIKISPQNFLLKIQRKEKLPKILAGQFVMVRVDGISDAFLRRPASINFVNYQKNEIHLLIQIVGKGTEKLSLLKKSDLLNIIFPLGNGFSFPKNKNANLLIVGGGVGVAPLLFLGYNLKNKAFKNINFLIGARNKNELLLIDEFEKYGKTCLTTDDGSAGECGLVSEHSILQNQKFDFIYACGPLPMIRAIAQYSENQNIECEVSLENKMACGFGACLCCATATTEGNVCVCTEGAVFNSKMLVDF